MVRIIKKAVKSSRETLYTTDIAKPLDRAFLILQGRPDSVSSRHYISLSGSLVEYCFTCYSHVRKLF